jgi:hypothetical protein
MMTWNYRIVKRGEGVGIYSVYYDAEGNIKGLSEGPERVVGWSTEDLISALARMQECLSKPILYWEDIGKELGIDT